MISDFREGGRFSKIGEFPCKKAYSIGGKSEIGGGGVKNDPQKSDIIYGRTLIQNCNFHQNSLAFEAATSILILASLS